MARITVEFGELIVEIVGIDQLWALRSQLEIPLAHVRSAAPAADLARVWQRHEPMVPAAGALSAGRFCQLARSVFWEIRDPEKAVAIEMEDDRCERLVVEVDDPAAVVARINRALAARGRGDD